ncbi:hypothetical protein BKA58DRAFT_233610 [Alternaria rosae]|uniref:uncharacterized protein n=1 Tax=Alternaria rosae TaxID=1187941 RepID=UPI001E8E9ECF|nr:uncharacterized protein BKA58DRAFT_233610 [Alternaria rosae]KAH6864819.1 hypothetical protein BKA58DRAFT_233610 [Alternaria rosae]
MGKNKSRTQPRKIPERPETPFNNTGIITQSKKSGMVSFAVRCTCPEHSPSFTFRRSAHNPLLLLTIVDTAALTPPVVAAVCTTQIPINTVIPITLATLPSQYRMIGVFNVMRAIASWEGGAGVGCRDVLVTTQRPSHATLSRVSRGTKVLSRGRGSATVRRVLRGSWAALTKAMAARETRTDKNVGDIVRAVSTLATEY